MNIMKTLVQFRVRHSTLKEVMLFGKKIPFGDMIFEDLDKQIRFGLERFVKTCGPISRQVMRSH